MRGEVNGRLSLPHAVAVFAILACPLHFAWKILRTPLFARMPMANRCVARLVFLKNRVPHVTKLMV